MKKDEIFLKSQLSEPSNQPNPAITHSYRFADVEIDAACGCLRRNGEEQHLRAQTFRVFLYLIEHRAQVVTKDELIEKVWQGTAVGDDSLAQCIKDIRKALGDDAHHPRFIKTIPKIGYRFISPVEERSGSKATLTTENVTSISVEVEEADFQDQFVEKIDKVLSAQTLRPLFSRKFVFASAASITLLMALALGVFYQRQSLKRQRAAIALAPQTGKQTLAVMYFENQSESRDLDWLREGLADMFIRDLSRSKQLQVLSRQQLHLLLERNGYDAGKGITLEQALDLAERSRAERVVLGSFARLGEKIQINVQLYDARTGQLIAAEGLTAERPEQIFAQVDLLSLRLAAHLGASPPARDSQAAMADVMTNNLDTYRYYSLALEKAQGYHSAEAIELWKKAIALDPQFAMAYARIGYTYTRVLVNESEQGRPFLEKAFALRDRLTEKDRLFVSAWHAFARYDMAGGTLVLREIIAEYPQETEAYWLLGRVLAEHGKLEEAVAVYQQGLTIDPEAKDIYNALGFALYNMGRYAEAIAAHEHYVALAPMEANAHDSLGMSLNEAGRYAEAIDEFNRALALDPEFHFAHLHLGDVYFRTGRYQMALGEYQNYLKFAPSDWDRAVSYNRMARLFWKKGDLAQAQAAAQNEIKYRNDFGTSFLLALAQGDRERAERLKAPVFENSVYAKPKTYATEKWLLYFEGYYALKSGQADEAIENFKAVVGRPPVVLNVDGVENCLADAYIELGRFDEAREAYKRILELNLNDALAHYHLAEAYEHQGETANAQSEYEKFLRIWEKADPDLVEVQTARAKLNPSKL